MANTVDLSQLAVERETPAGPASGRPGGRLWRIAIRYLLPLGIVLSFLGVVAWAARDTLLPAKPVTVVPVLVARAEVQQAGTPLFQAAGWVEPSPSPIVVSALTDGVLEQLNVVEGQLVRKGEVIGRLLDVDARLALKQAQAELSLREGELEAAQAELASAERAFENPVALRAELAGAESSLAELEAEVNTLPAALADAKSQHRLAEENLAKKISAKGAVAERVVRDARSKLVRTEAVLTSLREKQPVLKRQRKALRRKCNVLAQQLELKLDETRRMLAAKAAVKTAQARLDRARSMFETTELQLARTVIEAPLDGRVLSIQSPPGKRVNGLAPHTEQGSSAIVTMYDPHRLRVRVDVRLEDVPNVQIGQEVQIETAAVPEGLTGRVVGVTSLADIQKNTLQVKAEVIDPPDVLRPEMLAQVTFLAPPAEEASSEESDDGLKLLAPRSLIEGANGNEGGSATVWVADRRRRCAVKRRVTLGRAGTSELVEIVTGLTPTDRLICGGRGSLVDGQRIRIVAEDAGLGINAGHETNAPAARAARAPVTSRNRN
jgi:multidrug efflux pump subunit AcrA (membrane-fusion protein)